MVNPKSTPKFVTSDLEVVRCIRANYGYQTINVETSGEGDSLRYHLDDPNNYGPHHAEIVADERAEFARAGIDADAEFAKQ